MKKLLIPILDLCVSLTIVICVALLCVVSMKQKRQIDELQTQVERHEGMLISLVGIQRAQEALEKLKANTP